MTPNESDRQSDWEQFGGNVPEPATRVVHRSELHDVYIGRGDGGDAHLNNTDIGETGWLGNPYKTKASGGDYTREQSIALYRADVLNRLDDDPAFGAALAQLKGQRLACYCRHARETEPACHGDVLAGVIEGLKPVETADSDSSSDTEREADRDGGSGKR
jgi:hypothetical protein